MSEIVELLQAGRKLAWLGLVPAFDHAILLAQEAEYAATQATPPGAQPQAPVYPPLVVSLANSMRGFMVHPRTSSEESPAQPRQARSTFIPRHAHE